MKDIILLDGGLGQEVFHRASQPAHPLWSAKVMMDQPQIVKEVHRDFIKAGAKIITVNNYTCTPTRLQRDGLPEWFEKLQKMALRVAQEARDELGPQAANVQIAGCLPPLIGSYVDDSRSHEHLIEEYKQIAEIQAPEVDIFIIETISNTKEARAAAEVALETGKPVLLSFTLSDTQPSMLRAGESLKDALDAISAYSLSALLFNCSYPETISRGLDEIQHLEIPYGGYANAFSSVEALKPGGTVDALNTRQDLDEKTIVKHAMDWIEKGATIVGGCCEVGPSYIECLHNKLVNQGHRIISLK